MCISFAMKLGDLDAHTWFDVYLYQIDAKN